MDSASELIRAVSIFAIPVLFAITLHEAAHGYAARHFGDTTAAALGRISLNPARHIDPVGTLLIPILLLALSGGSLLFGWAKPVPVNFSALRRPKQDMLWVAAAGPAANLVQALFWGLALRAGLWIGGDTNPLGLPAGLHALAVPMVLMSAAGIFVNVALMVLNLLPLPPLDGGRIVVSLLPGRAAWQFAQLERWGFLILIVLLATGLLGSLMWPLVAGSVSVLGGLLGLSLQQLVGLVNAI
ncbi:MAG: site-2 protease family protein [Rhodocyclaceae bacterium]|nr:site-2 protease family protein [Rhodocyclaceae bacterium]